MVFHALLLSQNSLTENGLSQLLAYFSCCYFIEDVIFYRKKKGRNKGGRKERKGREEGRKRKGKKSKKKRKATALQISWLLLPSIIIKTNQQVSTCDFRRSIWAFQQPTEVSSEIPFYYGHHGIACVQTGWLLTFWIYSSTHCDPISLRCLLPNTI